MNVIEHIPGKDIGNRNWWGRQYSAFGWMAQVRIRREGSRQTNRRWLKVELFNYNYSEEAREKSRQIRSVSADSSQGGDA